MDKKIIGNLYTITKWSCLIGIPAIIVLMATLGSIWDWASAAKWCATLSALDTCLGTFVGITGRKIDAQVDGGIVVDNNGTVVDIVSDKPEKHALTEGKDTVKLKVMKDDDVDYGE